MRIICLLLLGFILSSCGPNERIIEARQYNVITNVYGERVAWESYPVKFRFHNSVPEKFKPAIFRAAKKWNDEAGTEVIKILEDRIESTPRQVDGESVIYFMYEWEPNKASEQGRTSASWVGDTMKEADILVNAKNFEFFSKEVPSSFPTPFDLESLMIHEMGHALAIQHTYAKGSVMNSYLSGRQIRLDLSEEDKRVLNFLVSSTKEKP